METMNPPDISSMPKMLSTHDKATTTDVQIPSAVPLFDDVVDGDNSYYDDHGLPQLCNLL